MKEAIWTPSELFKAQANLTRFIKFINDKHCQDIADYERLHAWSITNIAAFWEAVWEFTGIIASVPPQRTLENPDQMPGARWFVGARLNFAENLLRFRDDAIALVFKGENRPVVKITYAELYRRTSRLATALRAHGIKPGDRVAGFIPNMPEAIIAMLAATSLGACWSSCSPDFGTQGVLDRFGQIKPRVLFTADGYFFKGKRIDSIERAAEIGRLIPSIEKIVVVPYTMENPDISAIPNGVMLDDYGSADCADDADDIVFEQLPFDHPVYIMYSSGTTGLPKCMVQGPGVLLNHLKELVLHTDLKREDKIFYFTTCGWMMWNWLTSSLATGATLVLFDGNPFHPDAGELWKLAQDEKITVFGTSARYLRGVEEAGCRPGESFDLSSMRAILSTGSPLADDQFDFVYRHVKSDVQLASISGGTDLNGCFALGNPLGPVFKGELQCPGLGMKVEILDDQGRPVREQKGELTCGAPFPSMPLYFWDDPDGKKYHGAYFDVYPNVWRHGDFAEFTAQGGLIMHGRSDATLNPGGVRIGTADIYNRLENLPDIADSVVVGQDWKDDVRVILFVKMAEGASLTDDVKKKIVQDIRANVSPRHVPAKIIAVPDIPYTLNMKKVELAVKKTIQGEAVLNKDALRNPECLVHFAGIKELEAD